ncbi:MAG: CRISPR-associated endonuclease Cas1 [Pseudomonadota bacterium]
MTANPKPTAEDSVLRKSLYLVSLQPQHIRADDVRLIVSVEHSAPRPFPFSRIERIVSGPNAQWRGQAIAACLSRDIPIIWLDNSNHPVGDSHPLYREGGTLHQALQHYLDLPDCIERYANWLKSQRMDSLNRLRSQGQLGWIDAARHLKDYVYKNNPLSQPSPALRAASQSIVNSKLAQTHTRTRYWGPDGQPLELASDMAHLLSMEYHMGHPDQPKEAKLQIHHFETWWKGAGPWLERILSDLHRHISNEVETWL